MLLSLSVEERQKFLQSLTDEEATVLLYTWELWARPNQLEPPPANDNGVLWTTWLILAGRGYGKTRTGAETVNKWAKLGTCSRIALIAEDAADARDVMVEGESGIIACSPPDFMPKYEPSKRRLTWPNGCRATLYSAEDPDSLRGPQHDGAWCDELCKWQYAQDTWDNLQFGLRLGHHPRQIVTTTPKPIKLLKEIMNREDTIVTLGSTYENLENLAEPFRRAVVAKYEGTRLGEQELNAKILEDMPGALWQRGQLDQDRVSAHFSNGVLTFKDGTQVALQRIIVAVDPASGGTGDNEESNDEHGILVVGFGEDGRGYVLHDASCSGTPGEWGAAVVRAYDAWMADRVIYEANQGGEMARHTIITAAKALNDEGVRSTDFIPTEAVWASRGKVARAEPVSALYEQHRVSHVGLLANLEDQMCSFKSDFDKKAMGYSPDRVDALVWAMTHLMLGDDAGQNLMSYYRQEAAKAGIVNLESGQQVVPTGPVIKSIPMVPLVPPESVSTAYGRTGRMYVLDSDGCMSVEEIDVEPLLRAGFVRAPGRKAA